MMQRSKSLLLWSTTLASLIGLLFSGLLFMESMSLAIRGQTTGRCEIIEGFSCAPILKTFYALPLGWPLAALGGAFYLATTLMAFSMWRISDHQKFWEHPTWLALFSSFALASLVSLIGIFTGFSLHAICPFCHAIHWANFIALGIFLSQKKELQALQAPLWTIFKSSAFVQSLLLFGLSAIFSLYGFHHRVHRDIEILVQEDRSSGEKAASNIQNIHGPLWDQVQIEKAPLEGDSKAKIQCLVFFDFQCPYCQIFEKEWEKLKALYPPQTMSIRWVPFPLSSKCNPAISKYRPDLHPSACLAAKLALCADRQGHFMEVKTWLFEYFKSQYESNIHPNLSIPDWMALLKTSSLKLDFKALETCIQSRETETLLHILIQKGLALDVKGTPTWFINGYRPTHPKPRVNYFKPFVDQLLAIYPN